jgi:hypothetical protein
MPCCCCCFAILVHLRKKKNKKWDAKVIPVQLSDSLNESVNNKLNKNKQEPLIFFLALITFFHNFTTTAALTPLYSRFLLWWHFQN